MINTTYDPHWPASEDEYAALNAVSQMVQRNPLTNVGEGYEYKVFIYRVDETLNAVKGQSLTMVMNGTAKFSGEPDLIRKRDDADAIEALAQGSEFIEWHDGVPMWFEADGAQRVSLIGDYTREQLLALLHFHPESRDGK